MPCNVFIDQNGFIFNILGGLTEERLSQIIELNSFDMSGFAVNPACN